MPSSNSDLAARLGSATLGFIGCGAMARALAGGLVEARRARGADLRRGSLRIRPGAVLGRDGHPHRNGQ